jgi:hypothetical protein
MGCWWVLFALFQVIRVVDDKLVMIVAIRRAPFCYDMDEARLVSSKSMSKIQASAALR